MMDRFGPEIEADLRIHCGGADVLDVYRDRMSIRTALNLIDRCPQGSHWKAAWVNADDLVDRKQLDDDSPPSVPSEGYTPELERLNLACDLLQHLIAVTVAGHSKDGKVPKVSPLPRPKTALDRLRDAVAEENFEAVFALVQQMLPPDPADA